MKTAILFPGQGAQFVGMAQAWADAVPAARARFDEASAIVGFDLAKVSFEGPEDELNSTRWSQPAILTASCAILAGLEAREALGAHEIVAGAGLSLGEYTALVHAGAIAFPDAVRLVANRGRYMQECSDRHPSGMVSLLGASPEAAERICEKVRGHGVCVVANLNGPDQIVLSGANAAMDAVPDAAKSEGVRRAIRLKVSGAFHSPLMADASRRLEADLERVPISSPRFPVVCNVTAETETDPAAIRRLLARQVESPVLWERSVRRLQALGAAAFVEPGPGKVLAGLCRKIAPDVPVFNFDSPS